MSSTIHALRAIVSTKTGSFVRGMKAAIMATRQLRTQWVSAARDTASAGARIVAVIGAIGLISASTFAKFEQTMTRVGAVTKTLGTRDFALLEKAAREAGKTTKFSATQSAEAMENLGLAGLKTNEIMKALPGTLQLASAAQLSIGQAADIAAKTMRAYGMEAEELTRINDTLVATFTTSNTDLVQLAEALKPVGPLARTLNVSLEETSAVLAKLADKGYQGSLGGTALRNILAKLAGAAPEVTNKLRRMGIETLDASGNMRPLFDILQEIEAAGMSGGKIMELFGARGGPQMAALLSTGTAELRRYTHELENNQGIARELEQSNLKTLAGRYAILKSSVKDVVISVGKKLNPTLLQTISTIEKYLDAHRTDIVEKMSGVVIGLVKAIGDVVVWLDKAAPAFSEAYSMMKKFMGPVIEFLLNNPKLLSALMALKLAATLGVTQAITSLGTALISTGNALVSMGSSSVLAGTKLGGMLTATNLLKGGLVALGLALIALGAKYIYDNNEFIKKWNEETERAIQLNSELQRITDKRFNRKLNNILSIEDPTVRIEKLKEILKETNNQAGSYQKQIEAAQKRVERLDVAWRRLSGNGILKGAKEELEELNEGLKKVQQTRDGLAGHIGDASFEMEKNQRKPQQKGAGPGNVGAFDDSDQPAINMPSEVELKQGEISDILRDAKRDQVDQKTPGFSRIRDFIDLGPTQEQFREFLGTVEGMTPRLQSTFSNVFSRLQAEGQLTNENMDILAQRAAMRANEVITKEQEKEQKQKQVQDALDKSLDNLGQKLMGLKAELPNEEFSSLASRFISLRQMLFSGKIGLQQYESGIASLTNQTQKAAEAANEAAAAEERKRLIQGKFSQKDFKTALEDRIIAFRQQQFSNAVEQSFNALFGFNNQVGSVTEGFGKLRTGLDGFGERLGSAASGISQSSEQAMQTLRSFYSSAQGQAANLRNQITQLEQNMTLVDTYSARKRIQDMIDNLFNQIDTITQAPPPTFSGVTNSSLFNDPGLQTVKTQTNKIDLNFPNITKLNQNDIPNIYDALEQEGKRRGKSF